MSAGLTEATPGHRKLTGSSVIINVEDFDSITSFYRDVLELPVHKSWDGPGGPGMIVEVGPDATIELVGPPYAERTDRAPARGVEVMIGVDDAADWLDRLAAAGVMIRRALLENPWGGRSFGIDDPSGRRVWIFER